MKNNILVVDNDKGVLGFLSKELEAQGSSVLAVASGQEALDVAATGWADLVIMDLKLSDISGLDVLEKIREENEDLPIIICTTLRGLQDDYVVWASHVKAFLSKPIQIVRLKKEIHEALTEPVLPADVAYT